MEELERKRERNRREYLKNHEKRIFYARKYYCEHKEYFQLKAKRYRERKRAERMDAPPVTRPSIESLEESLPYELRKKTKKMRRDFLEIPITERPPYDVYLRQKTSEYLKQIVYERDN